jgi:hypothetical protein
VFNSSCVVNNTTVVRLDSEPHEIITYSFDLPKPKMRYLVFVERYPENIFVIKFCLKRDKSDKNRFKKVVNHHRASLVIGTIIKIAYSLYKDHPNSSFGFIGAERLLPDGSFEQTENTIRYRIYERIMKNMFGTKTFDHFRSPDNSAYLIVSRTNNNTNEVRLKAEKLFEELYEDF